ncbi:hypothetical protein TWF694_000222 [Orbilia ellipsospora]|uniref:Uncharacterized protein n=1 Tax=Orbilia ellipsospora TaxID=2528407 RepID=A0AAV9XPD3_9PEZI
MRSSFFSTILVAFLASTAVAVPAGRTTTKKTSTAVAPKTTAIATTTSAAAPPPNFYYSTSANAPKPAAASVTICNAAQASGDPNAFSGAGCTTVAMAYNTAVPVDERDIASPNFYGQWSLLHCLPIVGHNKAIRSNPPLNCMLSVVSNCQPNTFNYAVSFYGDLRDTTNVQLGPGKVQASWGTYLICGIPGQPIVGLQDPFQGGYVMPGEAILGDAASVYSFAPTPIDTALGTQVVLPTPH